MNVLPTSWGPSSEFHHTLGHLLSLLGAVDWCQVASRGVVYGQVRPVGVS
ncbi:hypothetical protein HX90_3546 [Mycobacterium tuberculosis]|nr:hypothetical protein HX90_3546 [Mycobacterium tuberculosis]